MKKHLKIILGTLVVLAGISCVAYPFVSNYLNNLNAQSEIDGYSNRVDALYKTETDYLYQQAVEYNKQFVGNLDIGDPFNKDKVADDVYDNLLRVRFTDIIATIEIPSVSVNCPIYHGTSDSVLQKGIGHIQGTSLPVGGQGTHSVLAGHSGLPTQKLFSDLDKLSEGDMFYIHVLDKRLAYKVDQIKTVLPKDIADLRVDSDKDYVSLVTCTPYGVNTHRLIVRGVRTEDNPEEYKAQLDEQKQSTWDNEYFSAILIGASLAGGVLFVYFIIRLIGYVRKKKSH